MTIVFFGSDPWFSPPVLEALLKAGHDVPMVVTKGNVFDKGKGLRAKGQREYKIIQAKTEQDITLTRLQSSFSPHPSSLIPPRPHAVVLAAFGPPFLGEEILDWPEYGCLNVHASLLPRWRGASPVLAAIAAGDRETGVSIMKMTRKIDRGPILGQTEGAILQSDTRESLTKRLGKLGGQLIVEILAKIKLNKIIEKSQPAKSPTPYTRRLTKDSGRIDWTKSPTEVERFIRAVTPWPSAKTSIKYQVASSKGKQEKLIEDVTILKAHLESIPLSASLVTSLPVEALAKSGHAPQARLVADLVQLPGKNPVTWKQFLAGHPEAKLM